MGAVIPLTEQVVLVSASVSNFEMRGWSRYWQPTRSRTEGTTKRLQGGRLAHEGMARVQDMTVVTERERFTQSRS